MFFLVSSLYYISMAEPQPTLRLATTTSTYETGLLDSILPPFERAEHIKVHVISVGTGKAMTIAQNGDVDVILVHDSASEVSFIANGYGVKRYHVMYNDFILCGPKEDPAQIRTMESASSVFKTISLKNALFVSRGDESGTHKKEKYLWSLIGINPQGKWYIEAGVGMTATLTIATEKRAYILIDRGTYAMNMNKTDLVLLYEKDPVLFNPYSVICVNPKKHPHVLYEKARKLAVWLCSPSCQTIINAFKKNSVQLFYGDATPITD